LLIPATSYEAPGPPVGTPGPPVGIGTLGLMVVIVGVGAEPLPGPPVGIGTPGPTGNIVGLVGGGITGGGTGAPGRSIGFDGEAAGGASAEKLLVRKMSLLLRAFKGLVVGADKPPAAGSISSPQAPHLSTESTYATSDFFAFDPSAADTDAVAINAVAKISFITSELFLFNSCKGQFILFSNF